MVQLIQSSAGAQKKAASPLSAGPQYPLQIVSGIQPALLLHLGHVIGALRPHVRLHDANPGCCLYLVADVHARGRVPSEMMRAATLRLVAAYLAFGLEPTKAILAAQSDLPELPELAWMLSCFTRVSTLLRNPPFGRKGNGTLAELAYPVLMAADILAFRGTVIPAGPDQDINVRIAREIARHANQDLREPIFPEPELRRTVKASVPGTDGKRMSTAAGNTIPVFGRQDELRRAVERIVTASVPATERKDPETCTVFRLFSLVATPSMVDQLRDDYARGIPYADVKIRLVHAVEDMLAEPTRRFHAFIGDEDGLENVLREGSRAARQILRRTLNDLRRRTGGVR